MNIALVIEGVMKAPASEAPIPAGIGLYKALVEVEHRLHLLSEQRDKLLEDWLKYNALPGYITLTQIHALDQQEGTLHRSLGALRTTGQLDLVIDADTARCADIFTRGYTVMPFLSPSYARPHWRPDYDTTPRAWDLLEAEVHRQRDLSAAARAAKNAQEE